MSDQGSVTTTRAGRITQINVDRVMKRNAFTPSMLRELARAFKALDEDSEAWVGVLSFAGEHTTAGLDLPSFLPYLQDGASVFDDAMLDPHALDRPCRKPIVCAVQGITYTIGVELMLASDIVVAASDSRFSQLETKRGIMPMGGATLRFVDRAGWGNAMYHLLRADVFGAERALALGFVQEIVEPGRVLERAMALAEDIAKNAPLAVQAAKMAAWEAVMAGGRAGVACLGPMQAALLRSLDASEGGMAMMQKREPAFVGK